MKDDRSAITDYNKAIELNSSYGYAYYVRGIAKIRLGQTDEGCTDIIKSHELGYENLNPVVNPCK